MVLARSYAITRIEVQDPLALKVLSGELNPGETIRVERDTDGLKFIS